jgi:hypothetical protein
MPSKSLLAPVAMLDRSSMAGTSAPQREQWRGW